MFFFLISVMPWCVHQIVSDRGVEPRRIACYASGFTKKSWRDLVGLGRFELPTSPLSGVRSNQLSYRPMSQHPIEFRCINRTNEDKCVSTHQVVPTSFKEVIQPQVPLGLPCYDFTPVMNHSVVIALPKVRLTTSGATHSHGVTGGVYKARERIHRDILIRDY